jgi:hypothetical protein
MIVDTRVPRVICRSAGASGSPGAPLVRREIIGCGFVNAPTIRGTHAPIAAPLVRLTSDALATLTDQSTTIGRVVTTVTTGYSTLPVHTTFGRGAIILIDAHRRQPTTICPTNGVTHAIGILVTLNVGLEHIRHSVVVRVHRNTIRGLTNIEISVT